MVAMDKMSHDNQSYVAYALIAVLRGDDESAKRWLTRIPRSERGLIRRACDDLDMILSRMGQ
jgi:hypothetical protein